MRERKHPRKCAHKYEALPGTDRKVWICEECGALMVQHKLAAFVYLPAEREWL